VAWLGTPKGLIRHNSSAEQYAWRYMMGPRWLPSKNAESGQSIRSLAVGVVDFDGIPTECAGALTSFPGVAIVCLHTNWTLDYKAQVIGAIGDHERHFREGFSVVTISLNEFGNTQSYEKPAFGMRFPTLFLWRYDLITFTVV